MVLETSHRDSEELDMGLLPESTNNNFLIVKCHKNLLTSLNSMSAFTGSVVLFVVLVFPLYFLHIIFK